jgi:hypothetical protein
LEAIKKEIEKLEMDISLSSSGFSFYQPSISTHLDVWKTRWEHFQRDLFLQLYPEEQCWLCIYGKNLQLILDSYKTIIEDNGFEIKGGGIWYEEGPVPHAKKDQDERVVIATDSGMQHLSYLPWKPDKLHDKDRVLYGVHWSIAGPGAWWFFRDEEGLQKWFPGKRGEWLYSVHVFAQRPAIPNHIHRMDYYTHRPVRRTVSPNRFYDSIYKIKKEALGGDISTASQVLNKLLQEKFLRRIRDALL